MIAPNKGANGIAINKVVFKAAVIVLSIKIYPNLLTAQDPQY